MLVDYRAPLELNHWEMGFTEFSPLFIFLCHSNSFIEYAQIGPSIS